MAGLVRCGPSQLEDEDLMLVSPRETAFQTVGTEMGVSLECLGCRKESGGNGVNEERGMGAGAEGYRGQGRAGQTT